MDEVTEPNGASTSNQPTASAPKSEADKLQILQLQCIIDAKDREIQLLRMRLSGQEDGEAAAELQAEVSRLRTEVQRLSEDNAALRAQASTAIPCSHGQPSIDQQPASGGATNSGSLSGPSGYSGQGTSEPRVTPPGPSPSAGPAATSGVDADALVGKLRALVSALVAEALSAQQQAPPPAPQASGRSQPGQQAAASQPHQPQQHASQSNMAQQLPHSQPYLAAAGAPAAAAGSAVTASGAGPAGFSLPGNLPGLHIIVQQCPTAAHPACMSTAAVAPAPPAVMAGASPASMHGGMRPAAAIGGGICAPVCVLVPDSGPRSSMAANAVLGDSEPGAAAPSVIEINVDGTVMFVDRAALEAQAAGSRLYDTLVKQYDKLPRDSQGRPYLSYDARVFQVLLSLLKERWLFGSSSRTATCDWPRLVHSLGVSPGYFMQVACHFGMLDVVSSLLSAWPAPAATSPGPQAASLAGQPPAPPSPHAQLPPDTAMFQRSLQQAYQQQPQQQPLAAPLSNLGPTACGFSGACVTLSTSRSSDACGNISLTGLQFASAATMDQQQQALPGSQLLPQQPELLACTTDSQRQQHYDHHNLRDVTSTLLAARDVPTSLGSQSKGDAEPTAPSISAVPPALPNAKGATGVLENASREKVPLAAGQESQGPGSGAGTCTTAGAPAEQALAAKDMPAAGSVADDNAGGPSVGPAEGAAAAAALQQQAAVEAAAAVAGARFRMPSLYTLLAQRQRAEEEVASLGRGS